MWFCISVFEVLDSVQFIVSSDISDSDFSKTNSRKM